jgi:hypothetical protein
MIQAIYECVGFAVFGIPLHFDIQRNAHRDIFL